MGFNLEDYEPVAVRQNRWLENRMGEYLEGKGSYPRTITHMVSEPGADICVIRAELWLGDVCIATGYAEEVRGAGHINRVSHVENCETSAVGRALANAGMAGTDVNKRPSREEMAKVQRATTSRQEVQDSKGKGFLPSAPRPQAQVIGNGMAEANGITVRGNQWGPLPDWLLLDAFQAGVSEVYDNRDQVAGTKRPWFKATTGGKDAKAFWPPKGTPDPVIDNPADDYADDGLEEPF